MRNVSSLQFVLLLSLCLASAFAVPAAAQSGDYPIYVGRNAIPDPADSPEPTYTTAHLNAVVVSSADGKPVPRVLVTSNDRRMAVMTDSEGRFSFDYRRLASQDDLTAQSNYYFGQRTIPLQFNVRKPGYITNYVTHMIPAVQPDTPEPTIQFKIVPAGAIIGHVYGASGDLPAGVNVQVRVKQVQNGRATWVQAMAGRVNSRGEFRIADLRPGDYKLLASAFYPSRNLRDSQPDSIPGFLPAYYPDVSSLDAATPIHVAAGETVTASLTLRSATFYKVTIPIANMPSNGFFTNLVSDITNLSDLHRSGDTAQGYLPSGDYDLMLVSNQTETNQPAQRTLASGRVLLQPGVEAPRQSIATVHLQVDGKALTAAPVAFHPSFEIPVVVHRDLTSTSQDNEPPHPSINVYPEPLSPGSLNPIVPMNSGATDNDLRIQSLSEGLYHVNVFAQINGYVAAVTSGTTDLLREPLRVLSGTPPAPIEVTVRDDFATLTGRVVADSAQLEEGQAAIITGIPLDRPEAQPVMSYSLPQQPFQMNLPPGHYLLLASYQQQPLMQQVEYRNDAVLRDLMSKGTVVNVTAGEKTDVQIPLMPAEGN